jgi:hypothetical protein
MPLITHVNRASAAVHERRVLSGPFESNFIRTDGASGSIRTGNPLPDVAPFRARMRCQRISLFIGLCRRWIG